MDLPVYVWIGSLFLTAITSFVGARLGLNGTRRDVKYIRERMDESDARIEARVDGQDRRIDKASERVSALEHRVTVVELRQA